MGDGHSTSCFHQLVHTHRHTHIEMHTKYTHPFFFPQHMPAQLISSFLALLESTLNPVAVNGTWLESCATSILQVDKQNNCPCFFLLSSHKLLWGQGGNHAERHNFLEGGINHNRGETSFLIYLRETGFPFQIAVVRLYIGKE